MEGERENNKAEASLHDFSLFFHGIIAFCFPGLTFLCLISGNQADRDLQEHNNGLKSFSMSELCRGVSFYFQQQFSLPWFNTISCFPTF